MSELQATLEFSVELGKFHNIDLFQRGHYQIRAQLKTNPRIPVKIETTLPRNTECNLVFPACISNGAAISKTFQILYRAEEVAINDIVKFKVNCLVDSHRIDDSLSRLELQLCLELFFTDDEYEPDKQDKIQCVSQRTLRLHFSANKGIHHYVPVLFDYFHLSAICTTIHGSLIALHPPIISSSDNKSKDIGTREPRSSWLSKTADQNTLETVLFGTKPLSMASSSDRIKRVGVAGKCHRYIANILLSAYESLQKSMMNLMRSLPTYQRIKIEYIDCHEKLNAISTLLKKFDDEEDILNKATSDLAQLCAQNVIIWSQYIELVTLNEDVTRQMASEHHTHRIRRMSEGFFTNDHPKAVLMDCHDPSVHGHSDLASTVRNSPYFQTLPPLSVECLELDGDFNSMPVVFEDVYTDYSEPAINAADVEEISLDIKFKTSTGKLDKDNVSIGSTVSNDSNASPKTRQRLGKKIIKNIKPSNFKRPSYSMQQGSASEGSKRGSVMTSTSSAPLIGYRKIDSNNSFLPIELGTLSGSPDDSSGSDVLKGDTTNDVIKEVTPYETISHMISGQEPYMINGLINEDLPDAMSALEDALLQTQKQNSNKQPESTTHNQDSIKYNTSDELDITNLNKTDADILADSISNALSEEEPKVETLSRNNAKTAVVCLDKPKGRKTDGGDNVDIEQSTLSSIGSDDSMKCTVIELLKEEYQKNELLKKEQQKQSVICDSRNEARTDMESVKAQCDGIGMTMVKAGMSHRCDSDSNLVTRGNGTTSGRDQTIGTSQSVSDLSRSNRTLVAPVADRTISFVTHKEQLRAQMKYQGLMFSDFPSQASVSPYFYTPLPSLSHGNGGIDNQVHLVVCVHGLDGNSADLRLVKTYLELALPGGRLEFLMSEKNQTDTFADFDTMTTRLVDEILQYCNSYAIDPDKVSFIGHSLGNVIIRSVIARPEMARFVPRLHTLLSLSGPHLGTMYNNSGLVNMGMWFVQKLKKSGSLLQLSLKDNLDPRQTFIYKLSQKPGLEHFKNVLLVSSVQDKYVPYHSTRIEQCKSALKDTSIYGRVYAEMVANILKPVIDKTESTLVRYDVFHALGNTANSLIGRAAHIAVLDSEIFIEKLMSVTVLKYFK